MRRLWCRALLRLEAKEVEVPWAFSTPSASPRWRLYAHGFAGCAHSGEAESIPRWRKLLHARQRVAGLAAARAQLVRGIHHCRAGRRVIVLDLIEQQGQLPVDALQIALLQQVFDLLPTGSVRG